MTSWNDSSVPGVYLRAGSMTQLARLRARFSLDSKVIVQRDAAGLVLIGVVGFGAQGGEALFEMRCELLVSWLAVEVVGLIGIGLEIVEFELLRVDEELDEFVAVGADAAAGTNVFEAGVLVVLVEPVLAPGGVGLAFGEREHALALHVGGNGQAGDCEKGWGDVEVQDHFIGFGSGLDVAWVADHHGHANGGLIHEALVVEMMLAEEEAVVGAEQDGGFVDDILALKLLPDCADVAIVVFDADVVVFDEFFEGAGIVAEDLGVADLVVGVGHGARLAGIVFEVLVEGCRLGDGDSVEVVDHVLGPVEGRVRRVEPEEEAEGLGAVLLEPLDGLVV